MTQTASVVVTDGLLFDMDGTLLDSTPGVLATWDEYAKQYKLDLDHVLKTAHGVRTIDNMRNFCGITDHEELQVGVREVERFEATIVAQAQRLQAEGKTGLKILPGVHDLLTVLNTAPKHVWAIVTSATTKYASAALPTAQIPEHPQLVTADHVTLGKPNPEPYLTGAHKLGLDPKDCIVVEDAPSGIKAGVAAGCKVLAVCTSHPREELEGLGAEWIVDDLSKVEAVITPESKVSLRITV
ncbi:Hexitol phosphatase A [Vanrija pseudolonga]|uniref:Hexitol phosphatase A n=1 Tax=Vanrija pseudolonga TaxID=143232 RepID=A0AAF0XZB9_9TREE|nr:Hexitol phosphatase A [Vanrija pseudolonga]